MPVKSSDPRNGSWEKALESGFPDCRVKYLNRDSRPFVWGGRIALDKFYCGQCGEEGGGVGPNTPFFYYLCDRSAGVFGDPPGMRRVG